ncbi:hypothetical protein MJH12_02600, partial [bacterium]|nr:hypothetical protein [bacterium]
QAARNQRFRAKQKPSKQQEIKDFEPKQKATQTARNQRFRAKQEPPSSKKSKISNPKKKLPEIKDFEEFPNKGAYD